MLKSLCGNVYSTSEHNYQKFNKIEAKRSFGHHVGGQEYALQHGGQLTNHTTLLKNQSALKYLP